MNNFFALKNVFYAFFHSHEKKILQKETNVNTNEMEMANRLSFASQPIKLHRNWWENKRPLLLLRYGINVDCRCQWRNGKSFLGLVFLSFFFAHWVKCTEATHRSGHLRRVRISPEIQYGQSSKRNWSRSSIERWSIHMTLNGLLPLSPIEFAGWLLTLGCLICIDSKKKTINTEWQRKKDRKRYKRRKRVKERDAKKEKTNQIR